MACKFSRLVISWISVLAISCSGVQSGLEKEKSSGDGECKGGFSLVSRAGKASVHAKGIAIISRIDQFSRDGKIGSSIFFKFFSREGDARAEFEADNEKPLSEQKESHYLGQVVDDLNCLKINRLFPGEGHLVEILAIENSGCASPFRFRMPDLDLSDCGENTLDLDY